MHVHCTALVKEMLLHVVVKKHPIAHLVPTVLDVHTGHEAVLLITDGYQKGMHAMVHNPSLGGRYHEPCKDGGHLAVLCSVADPPAG